MASCYSLLLAMIVLLCLSAAATSSSLVERRPAENHDDDHGEFIKASCGVTMYPEVCYSTLSSYAAAVGNSSMQLARAALEVTLNDAVSTCSAVRSLSRTPRRMKGSELAGAVSDCVGNMKDSVDQLKDSMVAMKGLDGPDFAMELGNLQTWVSAALTDEDTCMDGLEGSSMNGEVKDQIRRRIVRVAQLTSNALALINHLR